jgi:hypothetical protein
MAPHNLIFMGQLLALKGREGGELGQAALIEYIPANETFDNWTVMFAERFVPGKALDPKASAQATALRVQGLKLSGQDPVANAAVFQSDDGQSVIVDFLVSSAKPQMLEHNVMRYFKTAAGMYSFQFARRIYGQTANQAEQGAFIQGIPASRGRIFKEICRPDLPRWPLE